MTPEDLKRAMSGQQIPEHRAGFWDDVAADLDESASRKRRHPLWLIPFEAAAAVLALVGVGVILGGTPSDLPILSPFFDDDVVAIEEVDPPPTTVPGDGTAQLSDGEGGFDPVPLPEDGGPLILPDPGEGEPGGPVAGIDEEGRVDPEENSLPAPPWSSTTLELIAVDPVIVDEWMAAENQLWCSALYPAELDPDDAEIRAAQFAGGWALAWDLPDLRSAFGVAGVGLSPAEDTGIRMINQVHYEGVVVGYDGEGFDPSNERRLAEFAIPGQGCVYQVWSELGDDHLVSLVDSLRFVSGLVAEPIVPEVTTGPIDRGPAPWTAEPPPTADDGAASPEELPNVVATGGIPEGAVKRIAGLLDGGIAWDLPEGPGHDEFNVACGDCGRGVVGFAVTGDAHEIENPAYVWDDGSAAAVVPRVGDPAIPLDRIRVLAGDTGELEPEGVQIDISIPAHGITITVWSHLGLESVLEIVDGLRFANREQAPPADDTPEPGDTLP